MKKDSPKAILFYSPIKYFISFNGRAFLGALQKDFFWNITFRSSFSCHIIFIKCAIL